MFMVVKKKQITILTLIALVAAAGYINYMHTDKQSVKPVSSISSDAAVNKTDKSIASSVESKTSDEVPGEAMMVSGSEDYFEKAKNDREIVRSKVSEMLNETINGKNTTDEGKQKAENQLLQMASEIEKENRIESLLAAKKFEKSVVFISDNEVTVTVKTETSLEASDTAKINDIVYHETGNNKIKIVEVK